MCLCLEIIGHGDPSSGPLPGCSSAGVLSVAAQVPVSKADQKAPGENDEKDTVAESNKGELGCSGTLEVKDSQTPVSQVKSSGLLLLY